MRLIDADKMIEFIDKGKYCDPNALTFSENEVCAMIDEQPTAYDVDKVVSELEDASFEQYYEDYFVAIDKDEAIDIVKRGGVND